MNKKLLTQMWNEWRSNVTLFFELLIVSVVLWFMTDTLYVQLVNYFQPRGFDISHTYLVEMSSLSEDSYFYKKNTSRHGGQQVDALRERIRQRPDVEAVCVSYCSYPYNYSQAWYPLKYDTLVEHTLQRVATGEFLTVFRYESMSGETPEQLASMLEGGTMMVTGDLFAKKGIRTEDLKGKTIYFNADSAWPHRIVAVLKPVRMHDYTEMKNNAFALRPHGVDWFGSGQELCVRVKADQDHDFINSLMRNPEKEYMPDNVYIKNVESFGDIRARFQREYEVKHKLAYASMGFLLLNVFMALLGVFWFRTRQRRQEIAIHVAMGSTRRQVFLRLISEGLLLLCLATVPALILDYVIAYKELTEVYQEVYFAPVRFVVSTAITFLMIALTIVLSIWYPAQKATSIQPAEALHEE